MYNATTEFFDNKFNLSGKKWLVYSVTSHRKHMRFKLFKRLPVYTAPHYYLSKKFIIKTQATSEHIKVLIKCQIFGHPDKFDKTQK